MNTVITTIIEASCQHRFFVVLMSAVLMALGALSLNQMPLDALPDLSETQVIVYSEWDQSADIIENQVTFPLVSGLLGLSKLKVARATSDVGASFVYLIFEDGVDVYWARTRVLEKLSEIRDRLPKDVKVQLGPDASSLGWIYQYAITDQTGRLSSEELREIQDWNVRFQLESIDGVSEIASLGGFQKEIQVHVDREKLNLYQLSLEDVIKAVQESNQELGARTFEVSGTEVMIRSRHWLKEPQELLQIPVQFSTADQVPVTLEQVASVSWGPQWRRNVTDFNGEGNTVGGIVIARDKQDIRRLIAAVKEKISEINKTLPEGVKIQTVYDRSPLIDRAISYLVETLTKELLLVAFIIFLFLGHFPSSIVPIVSIPAAVLIAFIPLYLLGQSANLMSLAGIAISIGVLVDGAIIEMENAYNRIQKWQANKDHRTFYEVRLDALKEVGPSVFFSLLLVAVSFIPVFALIDREGRLFTPLALSKNITMATAALLAITLDPALRMLFSREKEFQTRSSILNQILNFLLIGKYTPEDTHKVSKFAQSVYGPLLSHALQFPKVTLGVAALSVLASIPIYLNLGKEFMPKLNEGSLLYMPTSTPGISTSEAQRLLTLQNKIIMDTPEVQSVFGKAGRASTATDTAPLSMIESVIELKDKSLWRKEFRTESDITAHLDEKLQFLGFPNIWTMPIQNRVDMLSSGIRTPMGIKIFGPDVETIERAGSKLEQTLKQDPTVNSVVFERQAESSFLEIEFDRLKLSHHGLSLNSAQDQALGAVGGVQASTTWVDRKQYPVRVRLVKDQRQSLDEISKTLIKTTVGHLVPLSAVGEARFVKSSSMIKSENGVLVGYLYLDLKGDQSTWGQWLEHTRDYLFADVTKAFDGLRLEWAGQMEELKRMESRLLVLLPVTLFLIILILQFNTGSMVKTGIVLLAVPFSMLGAFLMLWLLGLKISAASWVGLIALLGLDAEMGVFMLMYLDLAYREKSQSVVKMTELDLKEAVYNGALKRIRPKLMTVLSLQLGLLPILFGTGTGNELLKAVAAPMFGGLLSSFLIELLVYPVLFLIWKKRSLDVTN